MHPGKYRLNRLGTRQAGFVYVAVLVAMAMLAMATQGVMVVVSQQAQREREAALLQIGQLYVQAIGRYYQASPGVQKQWPQTLEHLLEDTRLVSVQRHIREIYPDPISRQDWVLIRTPGGGIQGVASASMQSPIRSGVVELDSLTLLPAARYADWQFIYHPPFSNPGAPPTAGRRG